MSHGPLYCIVELALHDELNHLPPAHCQRIAFRVHDKFVNLQHAYQITSMGSAQSVLRAPGNVLGGKGAVCKTLAVQELCHLQHLHESLLAPCRHTQALTHSRLMAQLTVTHSDMSLPSDVQAGMFTHDCCFQSAASGNAKKCISFTASSQIQSLLLVSICNGASLLQPRPELTSRIMIAIWDPVLQGVGGRF